MGDCCGPDAEKDPSQSQEETCEGCIAEDNFTTTFYFDKHRVKVIGCQQAVDQMESVFNVIFKDRIPIKEETTN